MTAPAASVRRRSRARAAMRLALNHYILNGLSVALGLLLIAGGMHLWLGALASSAAAVGVIVTAPPDLPAPRRGKLRQLLPAFLLGVPLFMAVQFFHTAPWRLALVLVPATFIAFSAMAWGKRGIPIAVAVMFSMIFSMATPPPPNPQQALLTTACFTLGAALYVVYATLANLALNARYRVVLLADTLLALAALMRTQSRQFEPRDPARDRRDVPAPALGQLLGAHAALADQLQSARDIVLESPRTLRRQRLAGMLVVVIEARDHLLAAELDLDALQSNTEHAPALTEVRSVLRELAQELETLADALLLGRTPAPVADRRPRLKALALAQRAGASTPMPSLTSAVASALTVADAVTDAAGRTADAPAFDASTTAAARAADAPAVDASATAAARAADDAAADQAGPSPALLARALANRVGYLNDEVLRLVALARGEAEPDLAVVRANWQLFVSPTTWSLSPFLALWHWDAPPLRHALRATLAVAAGYAIALALPWGTHDYWILLTIVVVLRGSLAQTLERRNARVSGTLMGCVIAVALLSAHAGALLLLCASTVAQAVAHGFAVRRYLVTSVAATVLGLLQAHLLYAGAGPTFALGERIADTLIGVALAWGAAYVLPSWERHQIGALVRRTLTAQARHARVALGLGQLKSIETAAELEWRLARREAFDSLSALVQATQRSLAEPRAVRPDIDALQRLQAHSYQLLAQLSAVKAMLLLRRDRLQVDRIAGPLSDAARRIDHALRLDSAGAAVSTDAPHAARAAGPIHLPDPLQGDISPWLLRRLDLATQIAALLRTDAAQIVQTSAPAPRVTTTPATLGAP